MTAASTQRAAEHSAPTGANSPAREEAGRGAATDLEYFGK